jgi:hypothetical protein
VGSFFGADRRVRRWPVHTYCFASRYDAEFVQMHFGGEFVDPNDVGKWSRVNGGQL